MNNLKIATIGALGVIVPSLLTSTAFAETWQTKMIGNSTDSKVEQIYAPTSDTTALAFICSGGKLTAAISADSNDAENIIENTLASRRKKSTNVKLMIDGEEVNKSKWVFSARSNTYMPKEPIVAVKLYNAAVKGESVAFKRSSRDMVELNLPAPNGDFVAFGGECGIGSNKTTKES